MVSDDPPADTAIAALELRLFGPLTILRAGKPVELPPSRKVRGLIAYLALSSHPVSRERLCALLWEVPADPRGELRWCLSKMRGLLDEPGHSRLCVTGDRLSLDLSRCDVDAARVAEAVRTGFEGLADEVLPALVGKGEFLENGDLDDCPEFSHWLAARRSEFHALRVDVLAHIARRATIGTPQALAAAGDWLDHAPWDAEAHQRFLGELFHRRRMEDCARHLEATARSFDAEGLVFAPIKAAWEAIRAAPETSIAISETRPSVPEAATAPCRASIAVMPFSAQADDAQAVNLGRAITHDVIERLARLRALFVIARGSVFAIAHEGLGPQQIGERLGVDYVATGLIERRGPTTMVAVEIAEAASAHIIWTERFETTAPDYFGALDEISNGIVSAIAAEIETAERARAILKPPDSLNAWEALHRGLWHMYRFTPEENARAADFFRQSARLDPSFSRAHAGLSFTHWQNAFQRWGDREAETRQALLAAGQSLLADDSNPTAHWSMGRALWLAGEAREAVPELERSVRISPNFALGHYALSFVHCQTGDPGIAIASSDHSRLLSPCDPLLFGMLASRAIALSRAGAHEEAAEWAIKAASRPNAHIHILAIAATCLAFAGRMEEAGRYLARLRQANPAYGIEDLLATFRFEADTQAHYRKIASKLRF